MAAFTRLLLVCLIVLLSASALAAVLAAPILPVIVAPQSASQVGLSASAIGSTPANVVCPAGTGIAVASAVLKTNGTLPGLADPCSLSSRDQAAATLLVASSCDGSSSCSPAVADVVSLFGDPCPSSVKQLEVKFACLHLNLDPPVSPAAVPPGNLFKRRPSTAAAPKCPIYAQGVRSATAKSLSWSAFLSGTQTVIRVEAAFVDVNITELPSIISSGTSNVFSLDDVAELNITAVNVRFPENTVVTVGKANPGFTTVRISAVNVIGSGSSSTSGALDVHSQGPDASGRFGPDVFLNAANVFGGVQVRQNGLISGHPRVSTGQYSASLSYDQNFQDPTNYYSACGFPMVYTTGVFLPPSCSGSPYPSDVTFQPLCAVNTDTKCYGFLNPSNNNPNTYCLEWTANVAASVYYGSSLKDVVQNDTWKFEVNTDRFTWPEYKPFYVQTVPNAPSFPAKSNPHGKTVTSAAQFFDFTGNPSSSVGTATWGPNPIGVFSTADYTIALNAYPSQEYLWRLLGQGNQQTPNYQYSGFLGLSAGWEQTPPPSGPGSDWKPALSASCPSNQLPFQVLQGSIAYYPSTASPNNFAGLDRLSAAMALNCLEEMISYSRFTDAQAFAADLAVSFGPGSGNDPALGAALGRIISNTVSLQTDRTSPAVHTVPFLSQTLITQNAQTVLNGLVAAEQALDGIQAKGTTIAAAQAGLQASLAQAAAQVTNDAAEVANDANYVTELSAVATKLNVTYMQAVAKTNTTQKAFEAGIKKKIKEEIASAVFSFLASVVAVVAGDVAAIKGMTSAVAAAGGTIAELFKDVEKAASYIANIATLINSISTLINTIEAFANQIQNLPDNPNAIVSPQISAQFANNTQALVSLSVASLNFKDLHDQAFIMLSPAVQQGIDGASDYALALATLANTGYDWAQAQIQLLAAQNNYVQDGLKLQTSHAQNKTISDLLARMQAQENALDLPRTVLEGNLNLLDGKMRALDLFNQACDAYSYAYTAECPIKAAKMAPNPTSTAEVFQSAIMGSLSSLDNMFQQSSCFCNASFVVTDPGFIGNLTANKGTAILDLSSPLNLQLYSYFGPFDNVHIYQINLKPYGIVPLTQFSGIPQLTIDVKPVGLFENTYSYSGVWYERQFLAKPYGVQVQLQPTNDWTVVTGGSLAGSPGAQVYSPTPYTRFQVQEDPNDLVTWDWSKVWGVQVELWGAHSKRNAISGGTTGPTTGLQYCSCPSFS